MYDSKMFQLRRLTSLKDVLLKQIVFNFPEIFLEEDPGNATVSLKEKVRLPPKLFESIQIMSHEIGWPIQIKHLKPCLLNRERLELTSINLSMTPFTEDDFIDVAKSKGLITHLKLCTKQLTDAMMDVLEKLSPHLEFLEINHNTTFAIICKDDILKSNKSTLKFPKLRNLRVNCLALHVRDFLRIDLTSCSETLESLEIQEFCTSSENFGKLLALKFIESWKSLKVLTNLRVGPIYDYPDMVDIVTQIESLRSLGVGMAWVKNPSHYLSRLMQGLPQLRHFSVLGCIKINDMEWLKNKKLNYLGFMHKHVPKDCLQALETTQKCGINDTLDNLIIYCEYSSNSCDVLFYTHQQMNRMLKMNSEIKNLEHLWQRMENLIISSLQFQYGGTIKWDDFLEYILCKADRTFTFSSEFLMRLANLVVFFSSLNMDDFVLWLEIFMEIHQLVKFMLNYVILNPCSAISSLYLRILMNALILIDFDNTIIEVKSIKANIFV